MPMVEPSVVANAVMAKLYNVLTNGDQNVPASTNSFFSWNTPGTPMDPADFEFLTQGLTGIVKLAAADTTGAGGTGSERVPLTAEQLERLRAQDTMRVYMQAENFARLVDFVPEVTKVNNDQFARMTVQNNDGTLSDVYDYTLRMSQVVHNEVPPETKEKIDRFRRLLQAVVKKRNIVTEIETETTEASELQKAYFQKMAAYEAAALEYNNRRIDALDAANSRAVHDWAMNANIYRNKVNAAMADWESNGYKTDFEQIAAFISQVSGRDMVLLKQQFRQDLERARLTSPVSGSDFFFTSLVPGNFATSAGWSRFGFSAGDTAVHSSSNFSSSSWQAQGAGGYLGIFGAKGGGDQRNMASERHMTVDTSSVSMSFEIAQVPIVRPWFRPSLLTSKGWRFDQNNLVARGDVLSDGKVPPQGKMPAYPTTAIFVRKLALSFGESHSFSDIVTESKSDNANGGAHVCFGPFFLGGTTSKRSMSGSEKRDWGMRYDNNTMYVDGMQLIGFKCHILPKCPDPDASIPATSWV